MKTDLCNCHFFLSTVFGILNCHVFVLEQGLCPCDRRLSRNEWIALCRKIINYLLIMID